MVLTRRSTGSGAHGLTTMSKTRGEGENSDTIHVQMPHTRKTKFLAIAPKTPTTRLSATPSSTGGMEDISLTSPSAQDVTSPEAFSTPKRDRGTIPSAHRERTLSSALRRLTSMPGTNGKGSAHNPIVLDEYSPRRQPPPSRQRRYNICKPHSYHPPRAALAPIPVKGNTTFTGHKNHDIYRMMNAKLAAEGWKSPVVPLPPQPSGMSKGYDYNVPFEVQYPLSAEYAAKRTEVGGFLGMKADLYAQYHRQMGVSLSGDSEAMLRKKAIQMVREYSRPQLRNKMPSDDPDETSASETERSNPAPGLPTIRLTPYSDSSAPPSLSTVPTPKRRKFSVLRDPTPTNHLDSLIAQTNLLNSLLQVYPKSSDQTGLREDISMLISVQNKRVAAWMDSEKQLSRKSRRSNNDSAISVGCDELHEREESEEVRLEKRTKFDEDESVRALLSAGAGVWGAGSVADAFAATESVEERVLDDEAVLNETRVRGVCGWKMA